MSQSPARPRRRLGCLPSLLLLLILGIAGWIVLYAAMFPWIYLVGGKLRPFPVWQGSGTAQTSAGLFRLYVWFSPTNSGSRILPSTSVSGGAYLCAPTGQRFSLRLTGGTPGRVWRNMDGQEFHLAARNRPILWQFSDSSTWRPQLSLSGRWVGPNLVMNDEGSLAHAFLADGSMNNAAASWYAKSGTTGVPITLTETWWWVGAPACKPGG
jgi:hypothetical protein